MTTTLTRCCPVPGCDRQPRGRGMCDAHLWRVRQYGDPDPSTPVGGRRGGSKLTPDALVEDVEWMLDTGEHPEMIATRCGYRDRGNLEAAILRRTGRRDLAQRLRAAVAA